MTARENGSFEDALKALEAAVAELESGDLPLERALHVFEGGVRIIRELNEKLNEAERRVEILTRNEDGELRGEPLPDEAGESE